MRDVDVIEDPAAAVVALDPVRRRLLAELVEPGSAATLAHRVGLPRQKVNYHLRALEAHDLVRVVGERRHGGLTERLLRATAGCYVVSPAALGEAASDPRRTADRLSARYLVALAARLMREVGDLVRRADPADMSDGVPSAGRAGQRVSTLALDAEIRFGSAADRAAFARDLTGAVNALAARYHDASAAGGRWHRLVVAAHPLPSVEPTASPHRPDPQHPQDPSSRQDPPSRQEQP